MKRKVIAAACLILGAMLLAPAGMTLWRFLVARLSRQDLRYLPDAQTDFMLSIFGQALDSFTLTLIATVAGALLLLGGFRMLIRKASQ